MMQTLFNDCVKHYKAIAYYVIDRDSVHLVLCTIIPQYILAMTGNLYWDIIICNSLLVLVPINYNRDIHLQQYSKYKFL